MDANSHQGGDVEPLVVLPGLLCDSRMFTGLLSAFPGSRVIDGFYAGCDRIDRMADYALERMPPRFALLGHSMGARIALEIVRRAPERVTRLALVDTGIHPVKDGEREKRYALRDIGRRDGMPALVTLWLPPMMGASACADSKLVHELQVMAIAAGLATFENQIEALLARPALDDLLPQIACPTYVVVGSEDRWSPVDQHRCIAEAIPGAHLRVVEGAGHMLPAEAPVAFDAVVGEWLSCPT